MEHRALERSIATEQALAVAQAHLAEVEVASQEALGAERLARACVEQKVVSSEQEVARLQERVAQQDEGLAIVERAGRGTYTFSLCCHF